MTVHRRTFLLGSLASGAAAACRRNGQRGAAERDTPAAPSAPPHPALGVQSGDVDQSSAAIWCRATAPGQMIVEWTDGDSFAAARRVDGPRVTADGDLCGVVDLRELPAGARIRYRCHFRGAAAGEAAEGAFTTAPAEPRATTVVWSGDVCGQGWGRNPDEGGYRIFDAMARARPDLFVCSGDLVYADDPLLAEVRAPDGRLWRNVVTPAKSKVAETLDDFRGNFAYNLEDAALQRFAAAVPIAAQWDDHEVRNNWYPAGTTEDDLRYRGRHGEAELAALARRALFDYVPFGAAARAERRVHRVLRRGPLLDVFVLDARSFRAPSGPNDEATAGPSTEMLGAAQLAWLEQELVASRARWKLIASSMPLGLVVRDGPFGFEAFAQAAAGPPAGRELELARLFAAIHRGGVKNVLFVTADVHYPAAHIYRPQPPFAPFHELVAGPLHAGGFGPNPLDPTFGPEVLWQRPPPHPNPAPWEGFLSYGQLAIARDGELSATWHGQGGEELHRLVIPPA